MNVNTQLKTNLNPNAKNLIDDIALFEEDEWDFYHPVKIKDSNYLYFCDMTVNKDIGRYAGLKNKILIGLLSVALCLCFYIGFTLYKQTYVYDSHWNSVKTISSITTMQKLNRIEGNTVDSATIVNVATTFQNYSEVMLKGNLERLNNFCTTNSMFYRTYKTHLDMVSAVNDINDSRAKLLKNFAKSCRINSINEVIEKDGIYYCYVTAVVPSIDNMYELMYRYSYDISKYFNYKDITAVNLFKYFASISGTHNFEIPTTEVEYCIQMENHDGTFVIVDDSMLVTQCVNAYSTGITQISNLLGNTKFSIETKQ